MYDEDYYVGCNGILIVSLDKISLIKVLKKNIYINQVGSNPNFNYFQSELCFSFPNLFYLLK